MYCKTSKDLWQGREDGQPGSRFHQHIEILDLSKPVKLNPGIYLIGFCCDEGVRRNQGRIGAKKGPREIRKAMCDLATWRNIPRLYDAGDIICEGEELEGAQEELGHYLNEICSTHHIPIVLGGGHETAWGSFLGLRKAFGRKPRLGIINIDAHFDLRPISGRPNSGTPFRQMAIWSKEHAVQFDYFIIGIQEASNTTSLFDYAVEKGVTFITSDDLIANPVSSTIDVIEEFMHGVDMLYLTIDLDVFDVAFAPGVSATKSMGLTPHQILPVIKRIVRSSKLKLVDICECNPAVDENSKTSKLAAALIYRLIAALH